MTDLLQAALALHRQGRLLHARALYEQILAAQPEQAQALHYNGLISLQSGEPARAVELIGRAIDIDPRDALAHFNRGSALQHLGRLEEALADYGRALALKPEFAEALSNAAAVLNALARHEESLASAERALALNVRSVEAHFNRAVALGELSREAEALNALDQVLSLRPTHVEAEINRGVLLEKRGEFAAALASIERVLTLSPRNAAAYVNRCKLHQRLGRLDAALADCDSAIAIDSRSAVAHLNRGNVLAALGSGDAAMSSYHRALALAPSIAEAHFNIGNLHRRRAELDQAIAAYDQALATRPCYPEALCNRGLCQADLDHLPEALADYDQALRQKADHSQARYNRAFIYLKRGDLNDGWRDYEARFDPVAGSSRDVPHEKHAPRWHGQESLSGKSILVYAEQGFGDTLQFCRYVPLLARLGARVVLEVPAALAGLLGALEGAESLVAHGAAAPPCDYSCPLMSLPLAFGTTLSSIPSQVPYLRADGERVKVWGERLGEKRKPRVGLVWSGGHRPNQPEVWAVDRRRNLPIKQLQVLRDAPVQFISLQKGQPAEAELDSLQQQGWSGPPILTVAEHLHDFADTAALMTHLDLLISVDTSVAHLAGAMAKPVWILNRYDACWRWLEERPDSPWYPTASLYRQSQPGDWNTVLRAVAGNLKRLAAADYFRP